MRPVLPLVAGLALSVLAAPARADEPEASPAPALAPEAVPPADPEMPPAAIEPRKDPDFSGFQLGLRSGYARTLDSTQPASISYGTPSLIPLLLDVGYRTSPKVYLGLTAQLAFASRTDCGGADPCSAKEYRFGATVQYHVSPFRTFDPWVGAGVGYEIVHLTGFLSDTGGHLTRKGLVLLDMQIGGDFALTRGAGSARGPKIGPFVSLALGTRTSQSGRIYGSNIPDSKSGTDHQWLMLGVRGTYDL